MANIRVCVCVYTYICHIFFIHSSVNVVHPFFSKIYLFYLFYFWLRWVFIAAHRLSLVAVNGLLFVVVRGLLIAVASLVVEHGL